MNVPTNLRRNQAELRRMLQKRTLPFTQLHQKRKVVNVIVTATPKLTPKQQKVKEEIAALRKSADTLEKGDVHARLGWFCEGMRDRARRLEKQLQDS